jgi:delta 1-pyrroline-5-carboxylate dehydrogenase
MEGRKRTEQILFWVNEEERAQIEERMAQLGTSNMSAFLRKMAIEGLIVKLELPELREMVSLLRYSSNNINQIAKRLNESGRVYDEDLEDILQKQSEIWNMASEILTRLAALQ